MIRSRQLFPLGALFAAFAFSSPYASAAARKAPETVLQQNGERLRTGYASALAALQAEIKAALPPVPEARRTALQRAGEASRAAQQAAEAAQQALGKVQTAKALVDHAKGKWIGGAEKGIAQAEAALQKATSEAEREAARKDLAKWQANKQDGLKALEERQAALDKAKVDEPRLAAENKAAQSALSQARATERAAAAALIAEIAAPLSSDRLDAKLAKCVVLAEATPEGLAAFAQQSPQHEALVSKLLADDKLMKEMLVAGGARFGKYGQAMQILAGIQKASRKAGEGVLRRLALATSLEHCDPVRQANAEDLTDAPEFVDPVQRYLHYEKAWLAGDLDPAFKDFSSWEYRMVVDCDAPDEILAWGRQMLRTYRPDHVANPDYGWRYSAAVKTDVKYGSQNVKDDLPSLNGYQNIPRNGGVCGRRAFFGRFILRSFGIPVWGVTQHKHAALSHWTPKGWVVNLGAGFEHSWWDKDEAPRSGSDFLMETQARAHGAEYLKVLRARWISRALGEQAFNDRKQIAGGFWSNIAQQQTVAMAAHAVKLGPLGQELAEADEPQDKRAPKPSPVKLSDQKASAAPDGTIVIPAAAHGKPSGPVAAMPSASGGTQIHCGGGFRTEYVFDAPKAGKFMLTARVATLQAGQTFTLAANSAAAPVSLPVPFTTGLWQPTSPTAVQLVKGRNVLAFGLTPDSRGVTIKDFTLKPAP